MEVSEQWGEWILHHFQPRDKMTPSFSPLDAGVGGRDAPACGKSEIE